MSINYPYLSHAYGLIFASNLPLADFSAAEPTVHPSVHVHFAGDLPAARESIANELQRNGSGETFSLVSRLIDGGLLLRLQLDAQHYSEFNISPDGSMLRVAWGETTMLSEAMPFLMNIGIGLLLRTRGLLCLHGAALAKDDRAIVLIGAKGAGKSTTTAALIARGWQLLADDISVVTQDGEGYNVESGFPRLRLLPETSAYFGEWVANLPRIWQVLDSDKRYLPKEALVGHFCDHALPLCAIYALAPRQPALTSPSIQSVDGISRLLLLANNLYAAYALDPAVRVREVKTLEALIQSIPLKQVFRPDTIATLPATLDLIEDDFARIAALTPVS